MTTLNELVTDFLAQKRIAVAGVSRTENDAANGIYRKFRDKGYTVFAVNPNAETVEGDSCYPDLKSIPGGVDGVVIVTRPEVTEQIVRECSEAGVPRVWMHKNFGDGSTSEAAVLYCQEHGIAVIPAGCPMMFCAPDFGHRCIKWLMQMTGKLPN
jgi:predicted CoA-binding protein